MGLKTFQEKVKLFLKVARYLGLFEALTGIFYRLPFLKERFKKRRYEYFFPDNYSIPFCWRPNGSDYKNYLQIFKDKEYSCLEDVKDVKLIVDCGGYIGLSSIWFLNRFPNALLVTVEPDPDNFRICRKNLRPYKKRVMLIHSAVWPHTTGLVVSKGQYRDGFDWSTQVRECKKAEKPDICSIDLDTLIKKSGYETVDILKVDIERAEVELFSQNYNQWLSKVRNIAIELHDEECKDIFFRALLKYNYDLYTSGEIFVCKNLSPKLY